MTDCTHTEHSPCAECRLDAGLEARADQGIMLGYEGIVNLMEAHAAAAEQRGFESGRREAFEEAAKLERRAFDAGYAAGRRELALDFDCLASDVLSVLDRRGETMRESSREFWQGVYAGLSALANRARAAEALAENPQAGEE